MNFQTFVNYRYRVLLVRVCGLSLSCKTKTNISDFMSATDVFNLMTVSKKSIVVQRKF